MKKTRILVTDGMDPEGVAILERHANRFDIEIHKGLKPEELLTKIETAEVLIVRSASKITEKVIQQGKNLKIIGRAGIGIDNVDVASATQAGIIVMNTPEGNAVTTAEHTLSLLMAAARLIPQANRSLWNQQWDRKSFVGTELFGKTAGVLGFGNIGKLMAERLRALKLNVLVHDPYMSQEVAEAFGVTLVSFDELLKTSDIITIHVPLLESTKNLINKEAFAKMKGGVILVNCARGGIVSEEALLDALERKKVKAAALDVFEQEPPDFKNPLLAHPHVVATPHLGAQTSEAQRNVSIAIAQQIIAYFEKGEVKNALNFPNLTGEEASRMRPYTQLGENLGSFLGQWRATPVETLEMSYQGDMNPLDCRSVTLAIMKGLLSQSHGERVNFVNSLNIAKELGLKVLETKTKDCEAFSSLITLKATSSKETTVVAGTLFGRSEPRLVRLNERDFETAFSKYMLVVENEDRPGVVGSMGMLLGKNKINIENMQLALQKGTGKALSIISVTSPMPESVLKELKTLDCVLSVKCIYL